MRKLLLACLLIAPGLVWGASAPVEWEGAKPFDGDLTDKPSLQNGMRLYMNYCMGCHGLQFQRYERTADDLGIPHEIALEKLVFSGQKIGELMTTAMDPVAAKDWFGAAPPDLTLIARLKDPEYIYNYLRAFYADETRPFGANNKMYPNVGMPNVLLELQGNVTEGCIQVPKMAENGGEMRDPLIPGKAITEEQCGRLVHEEGSGVYTPEEFDAAMYDLTNFLYYVGEPSRLERHRIGIYSLLFLIILGCFTYLLNREYWKDVH